MATLPIAQSAFGWTLGTIIIVNSDVRVNKIFAPLTSALTKKLLAQSASIVEKDFNTRTNIFIKIIITNKLAAIALF